MLIHAANSPIKGLVQLCQRVARSDATVLLTGETGTGKEVFARLIHTESARAAAPFVAVNCGAIPEALLESEFFGHERGAFTGAVRSHRGRIAAAERGTLFLDEVGELPLSMQVKLLRFLQERSYEAVGSTTAVSANIRVIAATHRDLQAEVAAGRFRQDLYYRLLVCPVALPALRNRPMDVPLLFRHFWDSRQETRPVDADVVDALMRYSWPGNVREMENMVERMSVCLDAPVITTACLSQFPQLQVDLGDTANADLPPLPPPLFLPVHAQAANSLPPTPVSSMPPSAVAFTTPPHGSAVAPFTMRATASSIPVTTPPAAPMVAPEAAPSDDYRDALLQLLTSRGLPSNMQGVLSWLENSMVDLALNATQGNRRHAAAMLGLQRTTLVEKLRRRERGARDERSDSGSMDTLQMQAAG